MTDLWTIWLAFAASSPAASDSAPPAVRVTERIEVVERLGDDLAERARVRALERDALERLPAETLTEALASTGPFVVLFPHPFGGTPMIVARGFFGGGETDYVVLDQGGLPLLDVESGAVDWQALRAGSVERVELLAGPASRGAGELALAGALSVEPRDARAAAASMASFGTRTIDVTWSATPAERWRSSIALDASETGGYRENSAAESIGGSVRVEREGEAGDLALAALARHREREEPGPLSERELRLDPLASNPLFDDDHEKAERWALGASWSGRTWPVELAATGDGRDATFRRTLLLAEGLGDTQVRETAAEALSLAARTARELAPSSRLSFGGALRIDRARADTQYFSDVEGGAPHATEVARRDRLALEVRLRAGLTRRLEVAATARGDLVSDEARAAADRRDRAFSPRIAVAWSPRALAGVELFGEAGRAFRAPTLDQRYDPRPFPAPDGGTFVLSSATLQPQHSRSWELGARGADAGLRWRALAYRMIVTDEIDFDPASFRYANLARSRHEGVEAELAWRRERGALELGFARGAAFIEGERRSGQLKNVPRLLLRGGVETQIPGGVEVSARVTHLGGRFADDANRRPLDDATILDLRAARRFGSLRVWIDLLNLADEGALELGYLLPGADGGESLFGFAPAPRAARLGLEWLW